MKQLIGWLGRLISYILYHSPAFVRSGLAWCIAVLWFDILRIRRKVILNNIQTAFPEWSEAERLRVARVSMRHQAMNIVEYCYFPFLNKQNVTDVFDFFGEDVLREPLSQGRGVLLLTLHLGNGDMAACAIALRGHPMMMVSKFFKLKWLNDLWFGMREKLGIRFIPPRNSSYTILKSLKANNMIAIPLDQFTGPPIGVRTTFFGKETGTAAGLAIMSERSKAPVVMVHTWRQENGKHAVRFDRIDNVEGGAERVTQAYNDQLEKLVRERPEQWMWLHKRWKRFVVH